MRQSLALSLLFLASDYFKGVVNSDCRGSGGSLGGVNFVFTSLFGDLLVVLMASRESLLGVLLLVVELI